MKTIKFAVVVLMIGLLAVLAGQAICSAKSFQSGEPWPAALEDDSNAPGTKLYGTLTIHFVPEASSGLDMYLFLRLTKGNTQYGFSGFVNCGCLYTDVGDQKDAIRTFIEENVVPPLFNCGGSTGNTCPIVVLKTAESYVASDACGLAYCNTSTVPLFAMMDIVIAAQ